MELGNVASLGLVAALVGIVTDGTGVEVADMVGVMTTLLLRSVKELHIMFVNF